MVSWVEGEDLERRAWGSRIRACEVQVSGLGWGYYRIPGIAGVESLGSQVLCCCLRFRVQRLGSKVERLSSVDVPHNPEISNASMCKIAATSQESHFKAHTSLCRNT